jgi:predicted PolB exonuclease-like 3'-5' exonuclease
MSGAKVWDRYQAGELGAVRDYCETDVLNTYLVFLRFQLIRGMLDQGRYASELERLEHKLEEADQPHLQEFLSAWRAVRHEP